MRAGPFHGSSATIERSFGNYTITTSVNSERLELTMQSRALHSDELGGPRNVAAKTTDLGNQIFALEYLSSLAQRQTHELLTTVAVRHRGDHGADILRQHRGSNHCLR